MSLPLSRRQYIGLSVAGALGAAGYGLTYGVRKVRDAASHMSDV